MPLLLNPDEPWKKAVFMVDGEGGQMVRTRKFSYLELKKGPVRTALYDLDRFRQRLCGESLTHILELDPDGREAALKDESALLRLGLEWVKQLLKKTFAC